MKHSEMKMVLVSMVPINTLHKKAQVLGKEKWYKHYKLRICLVDRDYEFIKD